MLPRRNDECAVVTSPGEDTAGSFATSRPQPCLLPQTGHVLEPINNLADPAYGRLARAKAQVGPESVVRSRAWERAEADREARAQCGRCGKRYGGVRRRFPARLHV